MHLFSGFYRANYTERATCCRCDSFYALRPPVVRSAARTPCAWVRACALLPSARPPPLAAGTRACVHQSVKACARLIRWRVIPSRCVPSKQVSGLLLLLLLLQVAASCAGRLTPQSCVISNSLRGTAGRGGAVTSWLERCGFNSKFQIPGLSVWLPASHCRGSMLFFRWI